MLSSVLPYSLRSSGRDVLVEGGRVNSKMEYDVDGSYGEAVECSSEAVVVVGSVTGTMGS